MSSSSSYKSNMQQIFHALDNGVAKANILAGREVINDAKRITRVDTGQMRDSYVSQSPSKNVLEFGNSVNYFEYQELGTKHLQGMQSLSKAMNNRKSAVITHYVNNINSELGKVK